MDVSHRTVQALYRNNENGKKNWCARFASAFTNHGATVKELRGDFEAAINHYITDCAATGRKPFKPASGKLMLRVSPEIHAKALTIAKASGKGLNQWAAEVLDKAAHIR